MIKKGLVAIVISSILLFSNNASAGRPGLIGGILCGIGTYCPPTSPPGNVSTDIKAIKNSPIGSLLPDYFKGNEWMTFYNHLNHFFKMQIGHRISFNTSGWGTAVALDMVVLKIGMTSDNQFSCFQYKNEIRVYQEAQVFGKEEYTGAACTSDQIDRKNTLNLYVETDASTINWIR